MDPNWKQAVAKQSSMRNMIKARRAHAALLPTMVGLDLFLRTAVKYEQLHAMKKEGVFMAVELMAGAALAFHHRGNSELARLA